jgi:hypothetical protein
MAVAFATAWRQWLIVPCASIFGARDSPSNYMLKGETRAHFAQHMPTPAAQIPHLDLVQRLILPPTPTPAEVALFAQATPDDFNPGIRDAHSDHPERRLPPFVDDTGPAHVRHHFLATVAASIYAAYLMFGHPLDDPDRPPCINPSKWKDNVGWSQTFLGYDVDTRLMRVAWPSSKRAKLLHFLDALFLAQSQRLGSTPHDISRILGLIRHAALVAPLGNFRSLRLQHLFNDHLSSAPGVRHLRRWYQRKIIHLPDIILEELRILHRFLHLHPEPMAPFWSRPIGLLVPRCPTLKVCTDASSGALGGWSPLGHLNHMWRISLADFVACGLPRSSCWSNSGNYREPLLDKPQAHINVLEFFALFIELWITLRQLHSAVLSGPQSPAELLPSGGVIISVLADNTSALSWLHFATRTKRKPIRRIARFLTAFLCHPFATEHVRIQGKHIPGIDNIEADHLSRFEKSPSWASVMAQCSALSQLRTCLVPPELLSLLALTFSTEPTEAWYETATTALWSIAPPVFLSGSSRLVGTMTSVNYPT